MYKNYKIIVKKKIKIILKSHFLKFITKSYKTAFKIKLYYPTEKKSKHAPDQNTVFTFIQHN